MIGIYFILKMMCPINIEFMYVFIYYLYFYFIFN